MRAVTFQGTKDIQVKNVADPILHKKDDIIVRITSTAICGSDLHIYQGALPTEKDYGIVEDVGPNVTRVKREIESFCRSTFRVAIVSIVSMIWKVNAIIQTLILKLILADTLGSQKGMATILADKLNCFGYHLATLCHWSFLNIVNLRRGTFYLCLMYFQQRTGALKILA